MLKERIKGYLEYTSIPVAKFCRRVDISTTTLYRFLKDDLRLSIETEERIKAYLEQYNF